MGRSGPILVILLGLLLFFTNIGMRDFWAPDEGDFGQIVRELPDNPVVPHLNGKAYAEKPPLFYYATFLSRKIFTFSSDEGAMRMMTALFALAGALFLFFALRHLRTGSSLLATLILVTSPLYYWQARYLQVDMIFSVFVSGTLLFFLLYWQGRNPFLLYCTAFCGGLAFMTKGPLALVLTAPVMAGHILVSGKPRAVGVKTALLSLLIFLCVVLPWYGAVWWKEGAAYLYENVIRQNVTRFFDAWSHKRPFYYYFTTLPLDFFPWSLFLPFGIYGAVKRVRSDAVARYLLLWAVWMFLFFSLSSGKISKYLLPFLPAAAAMTAFGFMEGKTPYHSLIVNLLSFLLCAAAGFLLFYRTDLYPEFTVQRFVMAFFALAAAVTLFLGGRKKDLKTVTVVLVLFLTASYLMANLSVYRALNRYKSPRIMAEEIRLHLRDGTPWAYYGSFRGVYVYYVGTKALHVDEHDTAGLARLGREVPRFYLLTRKRDAAEVESVFGKVTPVVESRIGDTEMVLILVERGGDLG